MTRITSAITYSITDRGRKFTGQDRSNIDVQALVDSINSPAVQEMVNTGGMLGYYGHQIRQRYGMNPPETVVIGDKTIRLEPSIRTVELSATPDGKITHREEFLENEAGEHAYKQYKAKIGGFSTAIDFRNQGNKLIPTNFAGFDYVWQPNYATNTSFGSFDGISDNVMPVINEMLENEIIQLYDSIQMANIVSYMAERTTKAEKELLALQNRQALQMKRQQDRELEKYDSLLCPTTPFSEMLETSTLFIKRLDQIANIEQDEKEEKDEFALFGSFLGCS